MNLSVAIACAWIVLGTWAPVVEGSSPPSGATDVLVVATCNVEDIVVTLLGDSGEGCRSGTLSRGDQGRAGRGTGTLVVSAR
jgi:hypothetical protein